MPTGKLSSGFGPTRADHPATHYHVALIEDHRLARGRSPLRGFEVDLDSPLPRPDGSPGRRMAVADLGQDVERAIEIRDADPVDLLRDQGIDLDLACIAHHHGVPCRIEPCDIQRASRRETEAPALAHRICGQALVLAQ